MYENPVLFPQISNRESWKQIIQLADDDTGDLIKLTDNNGAALYAISLEISPAVPRYPPAGNALPYPYYDLDGSPVISASLADFISIIDTGTIQIALPKAKIKTLCARTYDVFLTLYDATEDDGRQILIGKLPVLFGGINT